MHTVAAVIVGNTVLPTGFVLLFITAITFILAQRKGGALWFTAALILGMLLGAVVPVKALETSAHAPPRLSVTTAVVGSGSVPAGWTRKSEVPEVLPAASVSSTVAVLVTSGTEMRSVEV